MSQPSGFTQTDTSCLGSRPSEGRIALAVGRSTPVPGAAQTPGLHFLLGSRARSGSPAGFCRFCGFLLGSSSRSSAAVPRHHYCHLWYRTKRCLRVHQPGLPAPISSCSHADLHSQCDPGHLQHELPCKAEKGNVGLAQTRKPRLCHHLLLQSWGVSCNCSLCLNKNRHLKLSGTSELQNCHNQK